MRYLDGWSPARVIYKFPDEYSEWCDCVLANSSFIEIDEQEADRLAGGYNTSIVEFPSLSPRQAFTGFLERIATNFKDLPDLIREGRTPHDMEFADRFLEELAAATGDWGWILSFDSSPMVDGLLGIRDNAGTVIAVLRLFGCPSLSFDTVFAMGDINPAYIGMFVDAADHGITLDEVMALDGGFDSCFESWAEGVPVEDIFA